MAGLVLLVVGVVGIVLVGRGIFVAVLDGERAGIWLAILGLLLNVLAVGASESWLHGTTSAHLLVGILFWVYGVTAALATLFGVMWLLVGGRDLPAETNAGVAGLLGGPVGIVAVVALRYLTDRPSWLVDVRASSPFIVLPLTTAVAGAILGILGNGIRAAIYKGGSSIDRSGEWRIVGSNSKWRDATVRDMHDHVHGRGSWARQANATVGFFRVVFALVAAYGSFGILSLDSVNSAHPVFTAIHSAVVAMPPASVAILVALLAVVSAAVGLLCAAVAGRTH